MTRTVLGLIGAVLALAAVGKVWLVATDPFADIKLGYPFFVLWLAIICEAGLAYLNFRIALGFSRSYDSPTSNLQPPTVISAPTIWLLNFAFFCVLFVVSTTRWALGYVSCGCFGILDLPIWVTPLLDVFILFILGLIFPDKMHLRNSFARLIGGSNCRSVDLSSEGSQSPTASFGMAVGAMIGLLAVIIAASPGFVRALLPYWVSGAFVEAVPTRLGSLESGQLSQGRLRLINHSKSPVRILGSSRSCSCIALDINRLEIPARSEIEIAIKAKPREAGLFHQRLVFYLDHPRQYRLSGDVFGFVN